MIRRFFILLGILFTLNFISCGGASSQEAKELLNKVLQLIGIPYNIVVNICQDHNQDSICGRDELQTKVTITKSSGIEAIWRKISLTQEGQYFLETATPNLPILLELQDPKNISYDNGKFTLTFKGFTSNQENEIKELSAIQALEDAGYLTANETKALKALNNREIIDLTIFESLEHNYNLLRDEKLNQKVATKESFFILANELRKLDIKNNLPAQLLACQEEQGCIKTLVTQTSKELNITQEEAEVIADEVKKDAQTISQKNIADGYIIKLFSPINIICPSGNYQTPLKIEEKGRISLQNIPLESSCTIQVPSDAIVDSNNNGTYENDDKVLGFEMRGLVESTFITPLSTLVLAKREKGERLIAFEEMVKDFNPVTAPSAVALYLGEKKNRIQKLMVLMEILKIILREGEDISLIDLSQIVSEISVNKMSIESIVAKFSTQMRSMIMESEKLKEIIKVILTLDKLDNTTTNLNTLMVSLSDGHQELESAIIDASKEATVEEELILNDPVEEPTVIPTTTPTPLSTPTSISTSSPTPTPTPIALSSPTQNLTSTPTPTPTGTLTPEPSSLVNKYANTSWSLSVTETTQYDNSGEPCEGGSGSFEIDENGNIRGMVTGSVSSSGEISFGAGESSCWGTLSENVGSGECSEPQGCHSSWRGSLTSST